MDTQELITIAYVESCGNYILKNYYDGRPRQMTRSTLKDFEKKFCVSSFVRIHKQLIVNLRHIAYYTSVNSKHVLKMQGGQSALTISRTYLPEFLKQYNTAKAPVVFTRNDPGYLFL